MLVVYEATSFTRTNNSSYSDYVRSASSLTSFKAKLKTHLFNTAFN